MREPAALSGYARYRPRPELEPFVEHYWTVAWDLERPVKRELLPLDLGYADQAHFIRDFRRLVARTPARYERSLE